MRASRSGLIGRMALVAAAIATLITAGTQQAAGDITTGLVGHWKLDEGVGATTDDSILVPPGTPHNGTLGPAVSWVVAPAGQPKIGISALHFAGGADDYVLLANNGLNMGTAGAGDVTLGGTFTMAAWINPDAITASPPRGIFGTGTVGGTLFFHNDGRLTLGRKNAWDSISSGAMPLIVAGAWQHVAVTVISYDSTITFYLNGQPYAEANAASSSSQFIERTDRIGSAGTGEPFVGKIDDARIYNRALSASDMTELYNYPTEIMTGSVLIVR